MAALQWSQGSIPGSNQAPQSWTLRYVRSQASYGHMTTCLNPDACLNPNKQHQRAQCIYGSQLISNQPSWYSQDNGQNRMLSMLKTLPNPQNMPDFQSTFLKLTTPVANTNTNITSTLGKN